MKSITFFLSLVLMLLCNISFAQSEIETLEKMYQMVENDRAKEQEAQKTVLNFFSRLKMQIREKSSKLTESEYSSLIKRVNLSKQRIQDHISQSSGGYYEFYMNGGYELLTDFQDNIMDSLYKYIYN